MDARVATDFDRAWTLAGAIPGWLTRDQGRALWTAARRLRPGSTVVEIGSHQGRSTVVLGLAARSVGATVVAIDPFVDPLGGSAVRAAFEANIAAAGLAGVVELIVDRSTRVRPTWRRPIDLLYIDGKHDYWTYTDDLRWSAHLPPGADILVHDCFSSVGVTLGTFAKVLPGSRYTYLERTGSLARFTLRPPSTKDRIRLLTELGWFARNLVLKVLLRLRRPLRLLGRQVPPDPY
jgi:predicted O-methyltransferase YrrM